MRRGPTRSSVSAFAARREWLGGCRCGQRRDLAETREADLGRQTYLYTLHDTRIPNTCTPGITYDGTGG